MSVEQELDRSVRAIQQMLTAIGGLPATLDDEYGKHEIILNEWLGPDNLQPDQHLWEGTIISPLHPANGKIVAISLNAKELYGELSQPASS